LILHGGSVFYAFTDASSRIKIYRLGKIGKHSFSLAGRNTVYADIHLNAAEIIHIKQLSANYMPVHRQYPVNIF